jgi:hypothetical protein
MSEEQSTIKWDDDKRSGMKIHKYGQTRIYTREYAIELEIHGILKSLIDQPLALAQLKDASDMKDVYMILNTKYKKVHRGYYEMGRAEPEFGFHDRSKIKDRIYDLVFEQVYLCLETATVAKKDSTDFEFLFALGGVLKRNWKSGCAICLTDKIMGTTCDCGHTEIAVLRPCGHSFCANPCFEEFLTKMNDIHVEPEEFTAPDGQKFIIPSKKKVTGDFHVVCPMCKQVSDSVFRAEDVYVGKSENLLEIVNQVKTTIVNEFYLW